MGDGMGSFDISAFPGGSGFFVQHVESGETIVVTLIDEDNKKNSYSDFRRENTSKIELHRYT